MDETYPADLYIFCDASKKAYGFVAYFVQNGNSTLVFAKAKVAPLKSKTLPTLELLAVFLAVKCLGNILEMFSNISIKNTFVAVDAQIVLSWLLSEDAKTKNQFVRNRLKDISKIAKELVGEYSMPLKFKYIHTLQNPADLITRGLSFEKFKQNFDFWVSGPEWLKKQPVTWPVCGLDCLSTDNKEIVNSMVPHNMVSAHTENPIIHFKKFSKLTKLIRVISLIFKFVNRLKGVVADHTECAKQHLIKVMQKQSFEKEINYLLQPRKKEAPDLVKNLNLFLDKEGIIRSDGRIGKTSAFEYETIYPILLAKDNHLTKLIINDCHDKYEHLGIAATLNKLRLSGFWVPKARHTVRKAISECYLCKKFNAFSFRYPKITNLPKHRVNLVKPFLHTGIDYTGHVWVKDDKDVSKMYLLIFTCLNIRAVHIELVKGMSTHACFHPVYQHLRYTLSYL